MLLVFLKLSSLNRFQEEFNCLVCNISADQFKIELWKSCWAACNKLTKNNKQVLSRFQTEWISTLNSNNI